MLDLENETSIECSSDNDQTGLKQNEDESNTGKDFSSLSMVPRKRMYEMWDNSQGQKPLRKLKPLISQPIPVMQKVTTILPQQPSLPINTENCMNTTLPAIFPQDDANNVSYGPLNLTINSLQSNKISSPDLNVHASKKSKLEPQINGETLTLESILPEKSDVIIAALESSNEVSKTYSKKDFSEREIAYNIFVRRIVDDTLDRCVTLSHQPKSKLAGLEAICRRQFPDLVDMCHRTKIRSYLKACRRNSKKNNGRVNMKSAASLMATEVTNRIVQNAYTNEFEELKLLNNDIDPNNATNCQLELSDMTEVRGGTASFLASPLKSITLLPAPAVLPPAPPGGPYYHGNPATYGLQLDPSCSSQTGVGEPALFSSATPFMMSTAAASSSMMPAPLPSMAAGGTSGGFPIFPFFPFMPSTMMSAAVQPPPPQQLLLPPNISSSSAAARRGDDVDGESEDMENDSQMSSDQVPVPAPPLDTNRALVNMLKLAAGFLSHSAQKLEEQFGLEKGPCGGKISNR